MISNSRCLFLHYSFICTILGFSVHYLNDLMRKSTVNLVGYTDKKESKIFLIYKEIQSGAVEKSYLRKGFLIYEEMRKISPYMRRPLVIYDFATAPSEFPYL
jgi:hypothetical protein